MQSRNFVTGTTKSSGTDRRYDQLISLLQLKGIAVHFITHQLFRLNYGGTLFLWTATALSFHNQYFIWWEFKQAIMPIKIFHISDDVVLRKRSKHRTPFYDTTTTLPAAPLNVRLSYKNTPRLSAFGFQL